MLAYSHEWQLPCTYKRRRHLVYVVVQLAMKPLIEAVSRHMSILVVGLGRVVAVVAVVAVVVVVVDVVVVEGKLRLFVFPTN